MDSYTFLFWLVALMTGLSAISVVVTQNIVRAAAWLLFALGGTAGIFFLLGADFVGATQLIVYVGGTLVLVVFGVMLTAQGPFITMKTSAAEWGLSVIVGLLFLGVLITTISLEKWPAPAKLENLDDPATQLSSVTLGESLLGIDQATPEAPLTGLPANVIAPPRTQVSYLLLFEIVSVHLLVVLIGAAYLARAKRRKGAVPA
jgi:NADH:ubiquinone oxidoreductase subunit 6 (subunit J)